MTRDNAARRRARGTLSIIATDSASVFAVAAVFVGEFVLSREPPLPRLNARNAGGWRVSCNFVAHSWDLFSERPIARASVGRLSLPPDCSLLRLS